MVMFRKEFTKLRSISMRSDHFPFKKYTLSAPHAVPATSEIFYICASHQNDILLEI
jgi:hypothetical protein